MKNKNVKRKKSFARLLCWPVDLVKALAKIISEKLEFSIRFRLSLSYLRLFFKAMLGAGLGVILVFGFLKVYNAVTDDYELLRTTLPLAQVDRITAEKFSAEYGLPFIIYDQNQKPLLESRPGLANYGYKRVIDVVRTEDNFYLTINRSIVYSGLPARLVIYSDLKEEFAEVLFLAKIILIVFAIISLYSSIAIAFLGRGFFQPLKEMTQTVKDISERNLNLRLNVSGSKNELKELALTFNEMMNRIEDYYNRQKQFVSDASHELRTPIAVIQGYGELLDRWGKNDPAVLQESIDAIKNEAKNMQELIDKLLFLARHDKDSFIYQKEEFSLTEMLQDIVRETQLIDNTHQIVANIHKEEAIFADKNMIKQAIRIFIDNALKYTPPGGEIIISLDSEDEYCTVSIKDTGPGMSKEELEHIFDRFYRAQLARTQVKGGHGLGLAIAKIIITGHGGKIKVRSKVGMGSEFIILLKKHHLDGSKK
ncbi:MAG TPA: HAMP domain-containing protein [Peptococcaceae bacterium]|nr:HAMP domain-containing protein [Peptococcaceae bacterium]